MVNCVICSDYIEPEHLFGIKAQPMVCSRKTCIFELCVRQGLQPALNKEDHEHFETYRDLNHKDW